MMLRPYRPKEASVLAAVTVHGVTRSSCRHTTTMPDQGRTKRAAVRVVTCAVAVLVLMLPLGPALAANASTNSTQPSTHSQGRLSAQRNLPDVVVGAPRPRPVAMHNQLLATHPPDHAQLATGPARVILTFDLPAQRSLSTIIVTGPDGHQWQAGSATEQDTTVMAPLRPLGPPGDYTVAWRIVSADGHPVRGTFQFTLTTPGTGTPAASSADTDRATPTSDRGPGGAPVWPWLAGAGALGVAGVALALHARRVQR